MAGFRDNAGDSHAHEAGVLAERIDALASWISELEAQVRAATAAADPGTLKELARALDAWSKHDPKLEDRVTNRVDVLADRLATLSGTVSATAAALAGRDGEIAALRRELEQGNARIAAMFQAPGQASSSAELAELHKAVAALSADRRPHHGDGRADAMPAQAEVLAQRIDTLAKTVATTAAGLAGREGELAQLRRGLEAGGARAEAVVLEVRSSHATLSAQLAALEDRTDGAERIPLLEQRYEELRRAVESLGGRATATAASVETVVEALSGKEHELAALHRHFQEANVRADSMLAELRSALASVPPSGSVDPAVADRLDSLGRQVLGVTEQLAHLEALASARPTPAAHEQLEPRLDALAARLEAGEARREAEATAVARAAEAWDAERAGLQEELAALARSAAAREAAHSDLDRTVMHLATRLEVVERDDDRVEARVANTLTTMTSRLAEIETRLAEVGASASAASVPVEVELRLEEIAGRLDALEVDPGADEAGKLRVLVDGMRLRQASTEKELAALVGQRDVVARLDELAWRLDAVEARGGPAASSLLPPVAGDGRFRVELRGLELRMEHAESAARENREAVLTQLERLASRIEWRLQRLETAAPPAPFQPHVVEAPLGEVVPIRGEA